MPEVRLQSIHCKILKNINLTIQDMESVALLGPSGSGKSTLLKVIAGLVPHLGQLYFDETSMEGRSIHHRQLGYLSQDLHLFPHLNVENNIRLALMFGFDHDGNRAQRIKQALEMTRAEHLAKRYIHELSGGERQRVALARAIARRPKLLLLDEPFSSLDPENKQALWQDLDQLRQQEAITMLMVTHDQQEAIVMANRTLYIHQGQISSNLVAHQ